MYLLNLHFPGKSFELSSLSESLINSSCNQNTQSMPAVQASMEYCPCRIYLPFCTKVCKSVKFINNPYIKKSVSYKNSITKTLSIWSCLIRTNSTPGFPSLRKVHSRTVANSLLDCTVAAQLNIDCWICLWRVRNAPSLRKNIVLLPPVPCIWQVNSLSPKDSTQTNTNKIHNSQVTANSPNQLQVCQLPAHSDFTGLL